MTCTTSTSMIGCINAQGCGCGCTPCKCSVSGVSSPTPYYNQAGGSQENHCPTNVTQCFSSALITGMDFIVAACGQEMITTFPGLCNIQVGCYLWNASIGYMQVVDVDYLTSQVTLSNPCTNNLAGAGVLVPKGTQFTVCDPRVGAGWQDWQPTLSNPYGVQYANVIISEARYYSMPNIVYYKCVIGFDILLVDHIEVDISLPIIPSIASSTNPACGSGYIAIGGSLAIAALVYQAASVFKTAAFDARYLGIQPNNRISISGFYEV